MRYVTPLPGVGAGRGPISSGTQSTHCPDKCYPSLFRSLRSREADGWDLDQCTWRGRLRKMHRGTVSLEFPTILTTYLLATLYTFHTTIICIYWKMDARKHCKRQRALLSAELWRV